MPGARISQTSLSSKIGRPSASVFCGIFNRQMLEQNNKGFVGIAVGASMSPLGWSGAALQAERTAPVTLLRLPGSRRYAAGFESYILQLNSGLIMVSSPIQPMNWAMASLSIGIWPSPSNSLSKLRLG